MTHSPDDNPRTEPQTVPRTPRTVPRWRLALAITLVLGALVHLLLAPWTGWAIGAGVAAAIIARLLVMRGVGRRH